MNDWLLELQELGARFQGVDLRFRAPQPGWPQPWKASLYASKNERANYRLSAFGDTAEDAARGLLAKVAAISGEAPKLS